MSEMSAPHRDPADAKAWFYLDHRDDIEAWAALRSEARQLVDDQLVRLAVELRELAEEVGAEFEAADLEAGSWPRVGLRRSQWEQGGLADAAIVVAWERARLLTPGGNEWPYIAVRVPEGIDEARRSLLMSAMKSVRGQLGGHSSRNLPFWRYVECQAPLDPQVLAQECLRSLRRLWEVASPVIDGVQAPTRESH